MELVRRTIRMTRQKGKAVSQMTLDDDYNIPETMPDVGMIVQEKGDLEIGEVRVENGQMCIRDRCWRSFSEWEPCILSHVSWEW